jgi:Zn-dependent M28 family amino/carboxypeptidase
MEAANGQVGLDLKFRYDDTPENLLRRSDQWPFLQKGIPSLFIHTGDHPDYHQPGDTADKINYPKMEKDCEAGLRCGGVARQHLDPSRIPG